MGILTFSENYKASNLYDIFFVAALVYVVFQASLFVRRTKRDSRSLRLPPGPKGLPFIGNAIVMSKQEPWKLFMKWKKEYGELVYVSVVGQPIVILNYPKVINDLLDKRSLIYSERPRPPFASEMSRFLDWSFSSMPYNDTLRKHRRVFGSRFGSATIQMFNPAHDFASIKLLGRLLDQPDAFLDHIRLYLVQNIMMCTYGIIPKTRNNRYVVLAERTASAALALFQPPVLLADALPFLKNVPSWVPGTSSLRLAGQLANDAENMRNLPYMASKEMMSSGTLPMRCFVSDLLEEWEKNKDEKSDPEMLRIIGECATQAYGGASDSAVAALTAFVLVMALNPAVQKIAQAEITKVIGTSRLPALEDRKNLPYVMAVLKEVLRWHVVFPHGLPHMLKEDDEYNGYFLPKGSIIVGNSWGILHDPELYPGPKEFKPERYLNAEGTLDLSKNDPAKFAFGYGRRACPGVHFAENALFLAMSRILAAFDISPAKDERGVPILPEYRPSTGLISHPGPFRCAITPRSQEAAVLVRKADEDMSRMYNI